MKKKQHWYKTRSSAQDQKDLCSCINSNQQTVINHTWFFIMISIIPATYIITRFMSVAIVITQMQLQKTSSFCLCVLTDVQDVTVNDPHTLSTNKCQNLLMFLLSMRQIQQTIAVVRVLCEVSLSGIQFNCTLQNICCSLYSNCQYTPFQ